MEVIPFCSRLWLMLLIAHVQKSYSKMSHSPFHIIPSRLQLFEYDSVFFTCDGFNSSARWKVRNARQIISKCFSGTVKKTCRIDFAFASDSGEYWCESGAERSNTVNITVSAGSVILVSPVYPVVEGEAVSLHCKNKMAFPNFTAEFYKDNFLVGTSYEGELKIQDVSKSHEGLYKCKIHGVGESPESWMAIRLKPSIGQDGAVTLKNPAHPETEISQSEFPLSHLYYILLWAAVTTVLALQLLVLGLLYWKMQLVLLAKKSDLNRDQNSSLRKLKKNRGTETSADNLSFLLRETDRATNPPTQKVGAVEPAPHTLHSTFISNYNPQQLQNETGECSFMWQADPSYPPLTYQEPQYCAMKWENH